MSLSGVSLASATPINIVPDESLSSSHSTQLTKHDHSMSPAWIPLKLSLGLRITVKILNTLHCALCRPVPSWPPRLLYTTWARAQDSEPLVALKSSSSPVSLPPQGLWPRSSLSLEASPLLCLMLAPLGSDKSHRLRQRACSRPLRSFCVRSWGAYHCPMCTALFV